MALTYKKLSELTDMASGSIDATTKIVVTTGEAKTNNNLKVSDLIVDDLTTSNSYRGLSAKMGKKLQDEKAPITNPTFTGIVGGVTKFMVGLGNVDNTSDLNKPISTATLSALANKVDVNNPVLVGELEVLSDDDYTLLSVEDVAPGQHGRLNIGGIICHNLPEYEDNAAAIAGGLVTNELYRTSAGVVMCVLEVI